MRWIKKMAPAVALIMSFAVQAQDSYGLGKVATAEEMRTWVNPIPPTGEGLPPGRGTAKEGAAIYARECVFCHGPEGTNGPFNSLRGAPIAPYTTTIWDYIHRAMPRDVTNPGAQKRQLSPDEVYALTAYLLHLNGLIGENEVMTADSLPKVKMPIKTFK